MLSRPTRAGRPAKWNTIMTFYDELAAEYDGITDQAQRSTAAGEFVEQLTSRYAIRSAVDVACGTGLYSLILAKLGVDTIGADISAKMLQQADKRSRHAGLDVQWLEASMQELDSHLPAKCDAVLCMGNSLPHLLDDEGLHAALGAFRRSLNPGGVLAIHLLNYERILARQERIVGISRHGDRQYIRFYDFLPDRVRFNILWLDWRDDQCSHALHSTILRPYCRQELHDALARRGFADISEYGDLRLGPFDIAASEVLVITATV